MFCKGESVAVTSFSLPDTFAVSRVEKRGKKKVLSNLTSSKTKSEEYA